MFILKKTTNYLELRVRIKTGQNSGVFRCLGPEDSEGYTQQRGRRRGRTPLMADREAEIFFIFVLLSAFCKQK